MKLVPLKNKYQPLSLMDEIFDFGRYFEKEFDTKNNYVPPVEIDEDTKNILVKTELPGMDKKDIGIEFKDNVLTISGERKIEKKEERKGYFYSEISSGTFKRTVNLGKEVDFENATAEYKDGVLRISVPKTEEEKIKKLLIS
jgi:HSP20 family protein